MSKSLRNSWFNSALSNSSPFSILSDMSFICLSISFSNDFLSFVSGTYRCTISSETETEYPSFSNLCFNSEKDVLSLNVFEIALNCCPFKDASACKRDNISFLVSSENLDLSSNGIYPTELMLFWSSILKYALSKINACLVSGSVELYNVPYKSCQFFSLILLNNDVLSSSVPLMFSRLRYIYGFSKPCASLNFIGIVLTISTIAFAISFPVCAFAADLMFFVSLDVCCFKSFANLILGPPSTSNPLTKVFSKSILCDSFNGIMSLKVTNA